MYVAFRIQKATKRKMRKRTNLLWHCLQEFPGHLSLSQILQDLGMDTQFEPSDMLMQVQRVIYRHT